MNHLSTKIVTTGLLLTAASGSACSSPKTQNVRPQIYTFQSGAAGFDTKTYFYDNGQEVVAFDTQFTAGLAREAIAFLKTKTSHPLRYAVVTHPNPDKYNGMAEFQAAGAKVVMSEATRAHLEDSYRYKKAYFINAKMFTEESYPKLGSPDQTFLQSLDLRLQNGDRILLSELQHPGVSTNQTVAYLPEMRSLIVGDLIHYKAHAWLEGGIVQGKAQFTMKGWIDDLLQLQQTFPKETIVYGGRGESAELALAVAAQVKYLKRAGEIVKNFLRTNQDAELNSSLLEPLFVKEFPDYSLSYMITYGSYGLVQSLREKL